MRARAVSTSVIHWVFGRLILLLPLLALGGCGKPSGSDRYETDTLAAEASILASGAITDPTTPIQQEEVAAASAFWGFYLWRTRATIQHCEALGVPLSSYAEQFARLHENEIAAASAIYTAMGLTREDSWKMLGEFLEGVAARDLGNREAALTMSAQEVCQDIDDYSSQAIAEFHFSKALPEAHDRLTASSEHQASRGSGSTR